MYTAYMAQRRGVIGISPQLTTFGGRSPRHLYTLSIRCCKSEPSIRASYVTYCGSLPASVTLGIRGARVNYHSKQSCPRAKCLSQTLLRLTTQYRSTAYRRCLLVLSVTDAVGVYASYLWTRTIGELPKYWLYPYDSELLDAYHVRSHSGPDYTSWNYR